MIRLRSNASLNQEQDNTAQEALELIPEISLVFRKYAVFLFYMY